MPQHLIWSETVLKHRHNKHAIESMDRKLNTCTLTHVYAQEYFPRNFQCVFLPFMLRFKTEHLWSRKYFWNLFTASSVDNDNGFLRKAACETDRRMIPTEDHFACDKNKQFWLPVTNLSLLASVLIFVTSVNGNWHQRNPTTPAAMYKLNVRKHICTVHKEHWRSVDPCCFYSNVVLSICSGMW